MIRADTLRAGINAKIRSEGYDPAEVQPTAVQTIRAWIGEMLIPKHADIALALNYCDINRLRDELPDAWVVPTLPRSDPGRCRWPIPRVIVADNAHFWDARLCHWAASCIERAGTRLILCQHGGGNGLAAESVWEEWERELSDTYFSWGWPGERVVPVPSPHLSSISDRPGDPDGPILWIWNDARPQRYARHSYPGPDTWHLYQDWQARFLAALDPRSRARLLIRPFPARLGLAQYPAGIPLDDCRRPLVEVMREASMVIPTYNGTGFLEALATGTPVNAGWSLQADRINDDGVRRLMDLRDAGIWSGDPETVARRCAERQPYDVVARNRFLDRYGRRDTAWPKVWAEKILENLAYGS